MASVRLPLMVGVDTLWGIARGFALLVPSALLAGNGIILLARGDDGGVRLALGVIGFLGALAQLFFAWRSRASDAVLDESGLALEGGPHGGARLAWADLVRARLDRGDKADAAHVLTLTKRDGGALVLARAAHPAEKVSVAALHATLAARLGETPEPRPRCAEAASCKGCGAPLPPSELEQVHCPSCGARSPVAPEVRERVAAHRAAEQSTDPSSVAVRYLLTQPGATRASAALLLAGLASALGWVPVVIAYLLTGIGSLGPFEVGIGVFNGWAFTFAAFALARVALSRRRALQVLTTAFAALPPERVGDPQGCRVCAAPLPESAIPVVRCAYCGTESVLGLDVRPLLRQAEAHRGSVADLLRDQRAERGRFVALAAGGAIAMVVGGFWLVIQVAIAQGVAAERAGCERGEAESCAGLARGYASGSVVDKDDGAAAHCYGLACDLGHAESCRERATYLRMGWGVERDEAAGLAMLNRSCQLGFAPACEELRTGTAP